MRGLALAFSMALAAGACSSKNGKDPAPTPSGNDPAKPADAAAAQPAAGPADKCAAGDVAACDQLAEDWSYRQIVTDMARARGKMDAKAMHTACDEKNISSACMGLALMYKYGSASDEPDRATSGKYWGRVAELDDLNGYRGKDKSEAGAAALARTEKECADGRARSCNQLAWAAFTGVQRDKNVADAYKQYARGCELGSAQGCHWAGHFAYVYPKETGAADQAEAMLRKGCDMKNPGACDELGLYLQKNGKAAEALPLFEQACKAGARLACHHQAAHLAETGGDAAAIAKLDIKACDAGEDAACKALASRVKDCAYPGVPDELRDQAMAAAAKVCGDEPGNAVCSC